MTTLFAELVNDNYTAADRGKLSESTEGHCNVADKSDWNSDEGFYERSFGIISFAIDFVCFEVCRLDFYINTLWLVNVSDVENLLLYSSKANEIIDLLSDNWDINWVNTIGTILQTVNYE